jgi:hypothetical protein
MVFELGSMDGCWTYKGNCEGEPSSRRDGRNTSAHVFLNTPDILAGPSVPGRGYRGYATQVDGSVGGILEESSRCD